ncbi:hypothetical protein [Streptomyces sp. NPDC000229]|uniref:hypothetical protein n=1 Tax=Streptomyces sp. NPDC000229 TaxID=3154247 RepID=UPI003318FF82
MALLTAALIGTTAAPASGTSIIGFGNSAHDNTCVNQASAAGQAATTQGPGATTGLAAALPGSSPTNQCGNLGIPEVATIHSAAIVVNASDLLKPR